MPIIVRFSVIIPVHNNVATINRAITSVINQSYDKFEIIVVDDASTDSSIQVMSNYYPGKISVIKRNTPGPGGYAARNVGVQKAQYDWLVFLDADDEWDKDYLSHMAELIQQFPSGNFFSTGWVNYHNENKALIDRYSSQYTDNQNYYVNKISQNDFFIKWIKEGNLCSTISACVNKDLLKKIGGFPEGRCRRGGDIDTWVRLILNGATFVRSSKALAIYHRSTADSVTKKSLSQIHGCIDETIKDYLKKNKNCEFSSALKAFSNYMKLNGFRQHIRYASINMKDLRGFYFRVNPKLYLLFLICAIVPGNLVRGAIKKLRPIKGTLN